MTSLPRLALVGRPNVGKSTLFNRIVGRRKAITDSRPGSTRDRNYGLAHWAGWRFELVDTGGLLLESDDPLLGPAAAQAETAIKEADRVVLVVDTRAGLLPDDEAIAAHLRRLGKPVVVAANKAEADDESLSEFARLGFERVVAISAEHGQGVGDLLDAALRELPRQPEEEDPEAPPRIALVGRPNVGKSSLLNTLLREERAVVSAIPGTTRDAVDSLLVRGERRYLLVDTAGIRRNRLLREHVDHVSVVQSRQALERADVAVLVLDADEGLREMDATIAGYAVDAGRGLVLAVNKWDLAAERGLKARAFEQHLRDTLKFLAFAPVVYVSALTGSGLTRLFTTIDRVRAATLQRVTTGALNRVLARAAEHLAPKGARGGAPVKILYGAQIGVRPPTFSISLNQPVELHFSYRRYLENRIRAEFGFEGAPLRLRIRQRRH